MPKKRKFRISPSIKYQCATYRSFSGKRYEIADKKKHKSSAQKKARKLRKDGFKARVVQDGPYYCIYARR